MGNFDIPRANPETGFYVFPSPWKKIYKCIYRCIDTSIYRKYIDVFEASAEVTAGNGDTLSITLFS